MYNFATILVCCSLLGIVGCYSPADPNPPCETGDQSEDCAMRGWGISGELTTGAGVDGSESGIHLQAKLEYPDSVTTQFSISGGGGVIGGASGIVNARAVITSLINGNQVKRIVSVTNGCSITTRGENIDVMVRDYTDPGLNNGAPYQVSILSTQGVRANNGQPPLLFPLEVRLLNNTATPTPYGGEIILQPQQDAFVDVPIDAGINQVFITANDASDTTNSNYAATVFFLPQDGPYNPLQFNQWMPLPPNTQQIQMRNQFAAGPGNPFMTFTVTFGIDG